MSRSTFEQELKEKGILVYTNANDNLLDIITKASANNIIIDSISTINNKETSFIEVCTYINTKKIITMYPVLCDYYDKIPIKKLV